MSETPTIYVVDDDAGMCQSLRWLLEGLGYRVETFLDPVQFVDQYKGDKWGCLIVDLKMPKLNGLQLHQKLKEKGIYTPIIMISGHAEVPKAVEAMKHGILDFIEKPFSDRTLLEAIKRAVVADREQRDRHARQEELRQKIELLTERERDVLSGVIRGDSNKLIAAGLHISPKTVEYHRSRMMIKLGAESVAGVVRMVIEAGLQDLFDEHPDNP